MAMIYQVPKEVYEEFINFLKETNVLIKQISEFKPVGNWCLVKGISDYENLNKANDYLDMLISRI